MIEEIYEMYSRKVFLFLLSKTNNEDIAEELTQETFFQAVQCIDRFKGNSSILTWLCGIAKNVWLKDLRKRQEILSTNDHIQEIADEKEVNVQWEQKEILQLIHNMNEPIREVMYLRLVSNLSFAEIGEIIGKTENWTRVTFFRGKQKIVKEILKDDILSEQTKKDIDKHLTECRECQKKMAAMKTQLDIQNTNVDLKINPLKKVRFYQKILTVLGAVIAFILGACIPIAILGFTVLERGEIAAYQIERVKGLWYVLTSWSCASGIVVCVIYFLLILLIKKIIKKKGK